MKVDADLRCAIKSADRAQPQTENWEARARENKNRIDDLLKRKPSIASALRAAQCILKQVERLRERANELLFPTGICSDGVNIRDEDKFIAAGGKAPTPRHRRWKADAVIAELLAAAPRKRKAILKRYNIHWE